MPNTPFVHRGLWDTATRQLPPLKYLEDYIHEVTSDFSLPYPDTKYYTPSAVFHDNGVISSGADEIKSMMKRVFGQFTKIVMEPRYLKVYNESDEGATKYTIVAELMVSYYLKGDEPSEPVKVPRLMVFEIVATEDEVAYLGLNFQEVWLGWNVAVVKEEAEKRTKLKEGK